MFRLRLIRSSSEKGVGLVSNRALYRVGVCSPDSVQFHARPLRLLGSPVGQRIPGLPGRWLAYVSWFRLAPGVRWDSAHCGDEGRGSR